MAVNTGAEDQRQECVWSHHGQNDQLEWEQWIAFKEEIDKPKVKPPDMMKDVDAGDQKDNGYDASRDLARRYLRDACTSLIWCIIIMRSIYLSLPNSSINSFSSSPNTISPISSPFFGCNQSSPDRASTLDTATGLLEKGSLVNW
jgi:hypothetical protein